MSEIKNIILDFGGVILDLDFKMSHQKFEKLGIHEISEEMQNAFLSMEKGQIGQRELYNLFSTNAQQELSDETIKDAWCALLRDLPQHRVDSLTQLGKEYPLYLLSNTNSIHIDFLRNREPKKFEQFENTFKKVYYSHNMDSRKPDSIIFQKVIDELGINPNETLFVDDMDKNIETAKELGFQTWLFDVEKDDITKILQQEVFKTSINI